MTSNLCLFSKQCIGYVYGLQYGFFFFFLFFFLGAILNFLAIHLHCYGVNGQIAPIHELTECLCPVFEISFTIVN